MPSSSPSLAARSAQSADSSPSGLDDLRKVDARTRRRLREALEQLASGAGNLDVRAISGHPGWLRLRVGEHRVLYRPLTAKEARGEPGWLIARIIDRKELERAIAKLG